MTHDTDTLQTLATAGVGAGTIQGIQMITHGGVGNYIQLTIGIITILKLVKPMFNQIIGIFKKKKKGELYE